MSHTRRYSQSHLPCLLHSTIPPVGLPRTFLLQLRWTVLTPLCFTGRAYLEHQGELRRTLLMVENQRMSGKAAGVTTAAAPGSPNKKEETLIKNSYSKKRGILLTYPWRCLGHSQLE